MANITPIEWRFGDHITPLDAEHFNELIDKINEIIDNLSPTPSTIDITDQFEFTDGVALRVANATTYTRNSSTTFKTSSSVDISMYQGRTLRITFVAYKTGGGSRAEFGDAFFASAPVSGVTPILEGHQFELSDTTAGTGISIVREFEIPSDATHFVSTYFSDTKRDEFGADTFKCEIL